MISPARIRTGVTGSKGLHDWPLHYGAEHRKEKTFDLKIFCYLISFYVFDCNNQRMTTFKNKNMFLL